MRKYFIQNRWFFVLLFLVIGQLILNISYTAVKARPNAKVYFLMLHIVPQAICLIGLFSFRHWAWLGYIIVTGYNTFDFAKSLIIIPGIFAHDFLVFMVITLCINAITLVILTVKREYYE